MVCDTVRGWCVGARSLNAKPRMQRKSRRPCDGSTSGPFRQLHRKYSNVLIESFRHHALHASHLARCFAFQPLNSPDNLGASTRDGPYADS